MADEQLPSGSQQIQKLLDELVAVFEVYKNVLRANTVDFFTDQRIELLRSVNSALVGELLSLSLEELVKVACGKFGCPKKDSRSFIEILKLSQHSSICCETLGEGLCFTNSHSYVQSYTSDGENLENNDRPTVIVKPKEFMNLKKSHEVAEMSHLCSTLCRSLNLNQVIDIGSGKGYLSQYLTLQYGLQVVGIDSSDTNTHGAKERSRKLTRQWKALLRRAAEEKNNDETEQKLFTDKLMCDNSGKQPFSNSCNNDPQCPVKFNTEDRQKTVVTQDGSREGCTSKSVNISPQVQIDLQSNMTDNNPRKRDKYTDVKGPTSHFQPVTAFVNSATDLTYLAGTAANDTEGSLQNDPFLLIGLHTCGDLAAAVTKLFVDCPSARAMCYVPCCYHHVSEEFEPRDSKFWIEPSHPDQWGFPMSHFLRSKKVNVGRDAKMLACLAQERMDTSGELPVRSLYFRAVLQVLLKEQYRIPTRQEPVGKLANKCKDFIEYTRRALEKLGFDPNKLSDEEINQYNLDYLDKMNLLQVFTVARLAFSRMVESLLHMDKLCYLLEQPCIKSAAIVKLFDAVQSPRCYAIVATKESPS